ncbi:MAG: ATP-binding protein [Flavobacteriales bacterium]|nr:ATP-binding protein [Flavobacteriales bacterium]
MTGNLYNNAIKFTSEERRIEICANPMEKHVELIVKDNGVGIPKEILPRIFELDGSGSKPGTNNEKGTGLGLILCKDFIEKNGGEISVKSAENEGSTFKILLPKFY